MGQLGKYTTYVGGNKNAARTLLATLYPNGPFNGMLGDEVTARAAVYTQATADPGADNAGDFQAEGKATGGGGLQPKGGIQAGDGDMGLGTVNLNFGGAPDVSKIKWSDPNSAGKTAGNPANGYIPDITSPTAGPGHTEGSDKTGDPTGTIPEIQALATTSDPTGQNLKDPSSDGPAIYKANLGTATPLPAIGASTKGDSGGNV